MTDRSRTAFERDVVYLTLTTWKDFSFGAQHWYGRLNGKNPKKEVRVSKVVDQAMADALNVDYEDNLPLASLGGEYKVGDTSERLFSREEVIEAARAMWKTEFPNARILVLGEYCVDPELILEGPSPFIEEANALFKEAEAAGFWEGDEKVMKEVCAKWDILLHTYGT